MHDFYDPNKSSDYDVAIILLNGKIELSNKAQVIPLVSAGALEGGRSAVVTGWGALQTNGLSPTQLQSVEVHEVSREECNELYKGQITDNMICFSGVNKDSCQGDSGGPLVSDGAQIGIVSWGYGCADPLYPGVYAHVDNLRSFISQPWRKM
ncbi:hypothetical protein RI129_007391 [Pyrocoelia pectoralis]|uniref:Peptidase S1 domain-containing protein n=1 Tax=Pyrocoelia pectoralis TaxID=417401 RepID=A0AAN7VEB8_9COLE